MDPKLPGSEGYIALRVLAPWSEGQEIDRRDFHLYLDGGVASRVWTPAEEVPKSDRTDYDRVRKACEGLTQAR